MSDIIRASMEGIKTFTDMDTVFGNAVTTPQGVTVIPISKVSVGIATGGVDYGSKRYNDPQNFGGGGGTGLSITPVGFLVIKPNGDVSMLNCDSPSVVTNNSTFAAVSNLIEKSPKIIRDLKDTFKKDKEPTENSFVEEE